MKNNKKEGLQRFTNFKQKRHYILGLQKISYKDLDILTQKERAKLLSEVNSKLAIIKGDERDKLIKQFELVFSEGTRRRLWDFNHAIITNSISSLIIDLGRMPCKVDIQEKTGLSRPTIDKHLKEYSQHEQYLQNCEQFKFMGDKILAKVLQIALKGDLKACKLYLECMGKINTNNTTNTQNNYIQINGLTISQQQIQQLSNEQLKTIQNIITLNERPRIIKVIPSES